MTSGTRLVLGRYRLGRRLGSGGFGTVHVARDERLARDVALKIMPGEGGAPERARREALAAARLDHPGIVALYDAGEEAGARYLVSELVEGSTLADLEAAGALGDRDVLRVGVVLADALAHAHERGVVHRDVKPQNVLIPDHGREPAKLTDFGVALLAGDEPLTRTGDVVGTLAYMAPEQAAGARVDERADLYALALVLYEALSGHQPVKGASPAATAQRIGTVLPSLARARRDLPADLTHAIDRALLPHPDDRGDLADLADALEAALPAAPDDGAGSVAPLALEDHAPALRWRRPAAALAAGMLAVAVLEVHVPAAPAHPAALGALAGLAVLALPRLGWIAAAATLAALVALDDGSAGLALIVLAGVPVLLLPGTPAAWPAPAAALVLGLGGAAGAFPALAGFPRRWVVRAGLGAAGAIWLLGAAHLGEPALLLDLSDGVPARAALLVALWAAAAVVVPWVVRGRSLPADLVGATAWAAGLAAATASLATALGLPEPRGLVPGAVLGGLLALWVRR